MSLPKIVSSDAWQVARAHLLIKEKESMHARDALAAARRTLPMVEITKDYTFVGPDGRVGLVDLFDGRRQLIIYHFMFAPGDGAGCERCSFVADNIGHLTHLHARDTSLILVSRAPLAQIAPFKARMGWIVPWVSSFGSDFNQDFGVTTDDGERFGLSVFLRDGDRIFRTYFTSGRGVDGLLTTYNYLDLTPLGRQEDWEESPEGWPQTTDGWVRRHDEYDA
jgi:predicted dithiol-disulfide oxidoreductase (DUF899 family)